MGGREAYCPAKSVISEVKLPLASTGQTDSPPIWTMPAATTVPAQQLDHLDLAP